MFVLQGREFGQGVAQEGQVLVTPAPCHGLQVGFDFEPVLLEPVMVLLQALHMGKQFGTRPFQQAGEDNGLLGFVVLACGPPEEAAGTLGQCGRFGAARGLRQQIGQPFQFGQDLQDLAVRFVEGGERGQGRCGGPGRTGRSDSGAGHGGVVSVLAPILRRSGMPDLCEIKPGADHLAAIDLGR